ncbi:N-acetylmuramoyl-L-alanine amidase [Atopobacter phocae]|uniref:N-acetylmuramoyl-L-alanine amidase n=1 Tax=Atopobacter phocae TaxID=136492 RepID=UPI00046FCCCC|nr:N-acetylmuramoyl-L-alanine amidase [Atopobacter phocae]
MKTTFIDWIKQSKVYSVIIAVTFLLCFIILSFLLNASNRKVIDVPHQAVYESQETSSNVLTMLKKGDRVQVLESSNNWSYILTDSNERGYLSQSTPVPMNKKVTKKKKDTQLAVVKKENAAIRNQADDTSELLGIAQPDEEFVIKSIDEQWVSILYQEGIGYIKKDIITIRKGSAKDIKETIKDPVDHLVIVKANQSALYSKADYDSPAIESVAREQVFPYISEKEDFYYVRINDDFAGYIPKKDVEKNFSTPNKDTKRPKSLKKATIVIDPGHGGEDPGAVSNYSNWHEKDFTLDVSLALASALRKKGATVYLTREDDSSVSLADRAQFSHEKKADAFISIHFDSTQEDNDSTGSTTYFYDESDSDLAQAINQSLGQLTLRNNGAHFGNYLVLRDNKQPSILVELGYMNNKKDVKVISKKAERKEIVDKLLKGFEQYFK